MAVARRGEGGVDCFRLWAFKRAEEVQLAQGADVGVDVVGVWRRGRGVVRAIEAEGEKRGGRRAGGRAEARRRG